MQQDSGIRSRVAKRARHLALFVALAAVPVLALNSFATATTSTDGSTGTRPVPTDAQRECLAEQGVTLPTSGIAGSSTTDVTRPSSEERQALRRSGALPRPAVSVRGDHRGNGADEHI